MTKFKKSRDSVKTDFTSIKTPHVLLHYVHKMYSRFQKLYWQLWEKLITTALYRKVSRTDGQKDGQGLILMPADCRYGGIKNCSKRGRLAQSDKRIGGTPPIFSIWIWLQIPSGRCITLIWNFGSWNLSFREEWNPGPLNRQTSI